MHEKAPWMKQTFGNVQWLCLWACCVFFAEHGNHEIVPWFHEILRMYQRTLPLLHFRKWSCFTQLSHTLLTDDTRSYTLFPSLTLRYTHPTGQQIGKSKWQRGRARGSERLEEMKRVKRKKGKREWEAECDADGADYNIGSGAHIVFKWHCFWKMTRETLSKNMM